MNPYQRIPGVQQGHIDTQAKFQELLAGESLEGLKVVDLGCNCGMMTRMAADAGAAYAIGIDERFDYVQSARALWPDLGFDCRPIHKLAGRFDVGILSAVYHYLQDPRPALRQLARCCDRVFMDVWLLDCGGYDDPLRKLSPRGLYVPNLSGFRAEMVPFWEIGCQGAASTPDDSLRMIYHLSDPIRTKPQATLIHGPGGAGKTTFAKSFHDREILHVDWIHVERWALGMHNQPSILKYHAETLTDPAAFESWRSYTADYIDRWLASRINRDVVLEGYDLTVPELRNAVIPMLESEGWEIEEVEMEAR